MNRADMIVKLIILLLLEKKHKDKIFSSELAQRFIKIEESRDDKHNNSYDITTKLLNVVKHLLLEDLEIKNVIRNLEIILVDRKNLFDIIIKQVESPSDEEHIVFKKKEVNDYILREELKKFINISKLKLHNPNISLKQVLNEIKDKIENTLSVEQIEVDDGSIDDDVVVDLDDDTSLDKASKQAVDLFKDNIILKTGWSCLNKMLQGGFRRSEFVSIAALPHNYKSSFVKSLFVQIARLNEPILPKGKENKKPLLVFVTFEEEINIVLMFIYSYLKYLKEGVIIDPETTTIDSDELKSYIIKNFREVTKFNIKIIRKDPTLTNYKNIVKLVDDFDKDGYDVQMLITDYLLQISTQYCVTGATGAEYRDLYKKTRNAMSKRNILFISPSQLSPAAKNLLRTGIKGPEFLNKLVNKGYFEFSTKLDQEVDISIFITKYFKNRKPYLSVKLDKHRIPTVAEEDYRQFDLEFPKGAPIPEDVIDIEGNIVKTKCQSINEINEEFDI